MFFPAELVVFVVVDVLKLRKTGDRRSITGTQELLGFGQENPPLPPGDVAIRTPPTTASSVSAVPVPVL